VTVKSPEKKASPHLLVISILFSTLLLGCATTGDSPSYYLDSYTQMRSAVFTQRELINTELSEPSKVNQASRTSLINSYCDLVDRGIIYVSADNVPPSCQGETHKTRTCAMKFHQCASRCALRSNDCQPCIESSNTCLN